jgi:GABA(A) receptor-associated protein
MVFDFKKKFSFHQRQTESKKINEKYPDKIPIIVQKNKNCTLDDIDKHKFLVPKDMTVAQFIYILRKRIELTEADALYIFIDKTLPMTSQNINVLYNDYKTRKDFDGFMYVTYCNENTFG